MVAMAMAVSSHAQQCGRQAGGVKCSNCMCCSKFGGAAPPRPTAATAARASAERVNINGGDLPSIHSQEEPKN
uniref:Uncharacterized protein n=1 Tax=Leersia perrieri TaxID=77586 RepID=A0A0D9WUA7_9ORYZ